ncbi:ATP-grasp domain-containing protein [Moorena producens JHB]|uniref:ATP-grasp domain-containing protein n=1 Tax=Moorena producens (strain JHB) TaxID=1454205 RepID=A0A1D9FWW2_MOOP1|nr:ATP-grasp domain-containing protein [Moorena producens]AOY79764.1 ATP-grasp domain-containing protein [Moorena producens JHB]
MRVIFCDSVFDHKLIEPDYEEEMKAAQLAGFITSLFSFEDLTDGKVARSLRYVENAEVEELAIYRGWMLTPLSYGLLYHGLLNKNIKLVNTPAEFKSCHYLPEFYPKINALTPKSNWTVGQEINNWEVINSLTDEFGNYPIIVKDYVKSEKHNWQEACFIPDASNKENVKKIVERFIELRGSALNEGLVFRKFEELEFLTEHSKSGMPLTKEYRLFFVFGKLVKMFNYWDEGDYGDTILDLTPFLDVAKAIDSNFLTMDIAKNTNDEWIIIELGDGQTAGLPDNANKEEFYMELNKNIGQHV